MTLDPRHARAGESGLAVLDYRSATLFLGWGGKRNSHKSTVQVPLRAINDISSHGLCKKLKLNEYAYYMGKEMNLNK